MYNFKLSFEAIGTRWAIDCFNSPVNKDNTLTVIKNRAEEFDKTYSRFRHDSIVWEISQKPGVYKFPPDSRKIFDLYEKLYKITEGKFTLLIGNTLSEAGYDDSYSLKPHELKKVPDASSIYSWNYPALLVKKPYILDFGGLGKGYLIELITDILIENKITSFCIDGSGDIFCKNLKEPLRIGLENPKDFNQVIGVVEINNLSIAASSGSRRRWDNFHHIIDPEKLESPENVLSTWVIAKDALTADGLATCLFLVDPQKLVKYFDFEYLILNSDFRINKSENFSAELFTEK